MMDAQPGRLAREGLANILHFTAWHGTIEIMRALEGSVQPLCHEPRPLNDFEQHRGFRRANGLGADAAEYQAFVCMLSHMRQPCEVSREPECLAAGDSDDGDDGGSEIFVDAYDCCLEELCLV